VGLYDHDGKSRGYNDPGCPPPIVIYGRHTDVTPDPEKASKWDETVDWHGEHKCVLTRMGSVFDVDTTPGNVHGRTLVPPTRRTRWWHARDGFAGSWPTGSGREVAMVGRRREPAPRTMLPRVLCASCRHCHSQELVKGHRRRGWCELGHGWVWLQNVRQCLYWDGRGR